MGRGPKFVPVDVGLIEEGAFVAEINVLLGKVQQALVLHVEQYGAEAFKAKGRLTATIDVKCIGFDSTEGRVSANDAHFAVETKIDYRLPGRPIKVTQAVADELADGTSTLFCRASGTTDDDPRQERLATMDGRVVDLETGRTRGQKEEG